jgi:gluconolactonase
MKTIGYFLIAFALFSCGTKTKDKSQDKESKSEITILKEVEKLAGDFKFTKGPAADVQGNVYFTDIPENKIYIWTLEDSLKTYREESNGANGLYFDEDQNLWTCEGGEVKNYKDKYRGRVCSNSYSIQRKGI